MILAKLDTVIECKNIDSKWYEMLYKCDEFVQQYDKLPSIGQKDKEVAKLAELIWNTTQKFKNNNMKPERKQVCKDYDWFEWKNDNDIIWYKHLKECDAFYRVNNRMPSAIDPREKSLNYWIGTQRQFKKKGDHRLTSETQKRIKELCDWWKWENHYDSLWYDMLEACVVFYNNKHETPLTTSKDPHEKKLGSGFQNNEQNTKRVNWNKDA